MTSGVHGGGGVYSILKGNVYAGGSTDIMSIVDKQEQCLKPALTVISCA